MQTNLSTELGRKAGVGAGARSRSLLAEPAERVRIQESASE